MRNRGLLQERSGRTTYSSVSTRPRSRRAKSTRPRPRHPARPDRGAKISARPQLHARAPQRGYSVDRVGARTLTPSQARFVDPTAPPAFRAARAWSQKPHATVAAHESAAEEPVPQPFQPRGAQAVLRAFLGTSPRTRRTLRMKKNRIPGVDFFHASLVARLAGVLPTNLTRFPPRRRGAVLPTLR